jgi:hypothetical protein
MRATVFVTARAGVYLCARMYVCKRVCVCACLCASVRVCVSALVLGRAFPLKLLCTWRRMCGTSCVPAPEHRTNHSAPIGAQRIDAHTLTHRSELCRAHIGARVHAQRNVAALSRHSVH